jgi:hypothetical protein
MKKQILILIMALIAISFSTAYGQVAPRGITCLSADALHPVAGQAYNYTITVPNPVAGTKNVLWFVTQDVNFITSGSLTLNREAVNGNLLAAAGAGYGVSTAGQFTMSLTWKNITYNPANPIFVVMNVINDDGSCSPNNLKVYQILPQNTFTLDIANINEVGTTLGLDYGLNINECISNIVSAAYNIGTQRVEYDYGADTLMYEVVAANWTGQWKPSVQLTGIDPNETVTVQWSDVRAFTTVHPMAGSAVGTGATPAVYTSADNVTPITPGNPAVGPAGESIFIRVILDHTVAPLMYEGLTDESIALAVDGVIYSETVPGNNTWTVPGLGDVHYANTQLTAGPPPTCSPLVVDLFDNDIATQTVKARPEVNASSPTPFETGVAKP